jgi:hypothetical protein
MTASLRSNSPKSNSRKPTSSRVGWLMLICCSVLLGGCGQREDRGYIDTEYGRQHGREYGASVNGTGVIAEMFTQAGHHVTARSALSPAVENADVIVWFPDDFDPPPRQVRQWFENWMRSGYERTLVYVGRDFDAEPLYWEKAIARAPAEKHAEMQKHLEAAKVRVQMTREIRADGPATGERPQDGWFRISRPEKAEPPENSGANVAQSLQGEWSETIDPAKTEIVLNDLLTVENSHDALLYTDDSAIVSRVSRPEFRDGQLLLVQNGSFLLNLALVNHEHRHLAAQLIDAVEEHSGSESTVVFLESDESGVPIRNQEPRVQPPTEADYPPPISDMLYHAIVLAIVVTIGSWPIFGRARRLAEPPLSDFGQHVESLGDLLKRSRDDAYCRERVALWNERERR